MIKFTVHLVHNYMWKRAGRKVEIMAADMGEAIKIINNKCGPEWEISMIWPEHKPIKKFGFKESLAESLRCFPPQLV